MTIGLVGAHGTGKTTLAREFAIHQNIAFVETTTSQILRAIGIDPSKDYDLETRLAAQIVIRDELTKLYAEASRRFTHWIADRTPLDLATYLLCDIQRSSCGVSEEMNQAVLAYVDDCMQLANRYFGTLVLVQPGIVVPAVREGKAHSNGAFQEHYNALAFGLLMDDRLTLKHYYMKRSCLNLDKRKQALTAAAFGSVQQQLEIQRAMGLQLH